MSKANQKRTLGQNFLVDNEIIKNIIELSRVSNDDIVYEVGSGNGVLTAELCKISKFVHSFEIDFSWYSYCQKKLKYGNLNLFNLDGFDNNLDLHFDVFFSSLPYYESRNAFLWLCQRDFSKGVILLQKEFVEKLMSQPGNKNYRAISILSQYRFSINKLLDIPFSAFDPSPKVNSVLIEIFPKTDPLSKKIINDVQFLLSFRKKNVSFILKYFNKMKHTKDHTVDFGECLNKKLGQLSVHQIFQLNLLLNDEV